MWESGAAVSGAACHTEAVGALTFSKLLEGGDFRPAEPRGLHHQLKAKPRKRGLLPPGYRKGTISSSDRGHVVCYQATSDRKKTIGVVQGRVWKVKGKEGGDLLPDSTSHPLLAHNQQRLCHHLCPQATRSRPALQSIKPANGLAGDQGHG